MDLIKDVIPSIDGKLVWEIKRDFLNRYRFLIPEEVLKENPETIETIIEKSKEYSINELVVDNRRGYDLEYWTEFSVVWYYRYGISIAEEQKHISFKFYGIAYINSSNYSFSVEIIDPKKYHLKKLKDMKIEGVKTLHNKISKDAVALIINDENFSEYLSLMGDVRQKALKKYDDYYIYIDILYSIQHLQDLIAELKLYSPYLWDFESNKEWYNNKYNYSYFPSFYDQQYMFLSEQIFQNLYIFWDKVGDLLELFFIIGKIRNGNIYFINVIRSFPNEYKNEDYQWLLDFLDKDFMGLNEKRIEIVHLRGQGTSFFDKFLKTHQQDEEIKKIQSYRDGLYDYFVNQFKFCVIGWGKALSLINSK